MNEFKKAKTMAKPALKDQSTVAPVGWSIGLTEVIPDSFMWSTRPLFADCHVEAFGEIEEYVVWQHNWQADTNVKGMEPVRTVMLLVQPHLMSGMIENPYAAFAYGVRWPVSNSEFVTILMVSTDEEPFSETLVREYDAFTSKEFPSVSLLVTDHKLALGGSCVDEDIVMKYLMLSYARPRVYNMVYENAEAFEKKLMLEFIPSLVDTETYGYDYQGIEDLGFKGGLDIFNER